MCDLPGFLEPIGVYLEFNPDAFQRAYQVFAKEVELCANSHYVWLSDDLQPSQERALRHEFLLDVLSTVRREHTAKPSRAAAAACQAGGPPAGSARS